ncbi:MAG: hypothetical protein ACNA8W_04125 [Bradymonadaceae bacterium]
MSFAPSYRATRKGRTGSRQLKIVLLIGGVLIITFGGSLAWVVVGLAVMLLSLLVPVPELRKRSLMTRFRALRGERSRRVRVPGKIVHDGRRVELHEGDAMLRRVLVTKDFTLEERSYHGHPCLGLMGPGRRKKDAIWICSKAELLDETEALTGKEADILAVVDDESFRKLRNTLSD